MHFFAEFIYLQASAGLVASWLPHFAELAVELADFAV